MQTQGLNHLRCYYLTLLLFRKVSTSSHLPSVLLTLCDHVTNTLILLSLCADASIVWHITVKSGVENKWNRYSGILSVALNLLMMLVWLAST